MRNKANFFKHFNVRISKDIIASPFSRKKVKPKNRIHVNPPALRGCHPRF